MFCTNSKCYGGKVLKITRRTKDESYREVWVTCPECKGEWNPDAVDLSKHFPEIKQAETIDDREDLPF